MSDSALLSSVIARIYDAAIDPSQWEQALEGACAFVGGRSAALFWHDAASDSSAALHLFNEDPYYTQLYFERYSAMNPMFPAGSFVEVGSVVNMTDMMPLDEFIQTRFYKEWVQPQGILDAISTNLEKDVTRASLLNIRLDASRGIASNDMRHRMRLLVPHFQRAVAFGRLFDQHNAARYALAETLNHVEAPIFLIAADGRIAFANVPARAMLDEGSLVHERNQAFSAVAPETDRLLREIFTAAEKGDVSLGVRGVAVPIAVAGPERWFAHVLPLTSGQRQQAGTAYAAVAAVFIRKTSPNVPPPLEAIAKLYKLTASEVRVLDALIHVSSVKAISELLGVSQATVKTHLHNLFRKTRTARQSELVKLVAGI